MISHKAIEDLRSLEGLAWITALKSAQIRSLVQGGALQLGLFDIVLFMGVLYHLPDMLRGLHIVRQVCGGVMFLETHADNTAGPELPVARYYRGASLAGDHTNFWSPNRRCVHDMLFDAGFEVDYDDPAGDRLFVAARAVTMEGLRHEKMRIAYGTVGS